MSYDLDTGNDVDSFLDAMAFSEEDEAKAREALADAKSLIWAHEYDYDGSAWLVVLKEDGWFFWYDSHCSCFGFEWDAGLEKSHPDALLDMEFHRLDGREAIYSFVREHRGDELERQVGKVFE